MASTPTIVGEILPATLYTLSRAQEISGLGASSFREARRKGLRVLYIGRTAFVRGSDLIGYIEANATAEKPGQG